jgi:hypothetical protein
MTIIAKPIVKDQLWVLTDGQSKIGNIEHDQGLYRVKIGDHEISVENKRSIQRIAKIEFEHPSNITTTSKIPYARWPVHTTPHNNMYDVKRKIHLYTDDSKSKCYYAAGYFALKMNDVWSVEFCPKYIFISRYPYHGPYLTQEQANNSINNV